MGSEGLNPIRITSGVGVISGKFINMCIGSSVVSVCLLCNALTLRINVLT